MSYFAQAGFIHHVEVEQHMPYEFRAVEAVFGFEGHVKSSKAKAQIVVAVRFSVAVHRRKITFHFRVDFVVNVYGHDGGVRFRKAQKGSPAGGFGYETSYKGVVGSAPAEGVHDA